MVPHDNDAILLLSFLLGRFISLDDNDRGDYSDAVVLRTTTEQEERVVVRDRFVGRDCIRRGQ
jgi:hypothetical protein